MDLPVKDMDEQGVCSMPLPDLCSGHTLSRTLVRLRDVSNLAWRKNRQQERQTPTNANNSHLF
jgi:hypothetical protein